MMDNQFDRFDSGNDELNELLSSDKIDSEEREELIKAFTATLIDDPLGDGKAEDYHSLFTTIQIKYVDRKLTELRSAKNPTQADDEKALGYCNRLRELIDLFASEGKDLPPIKNTHPEDYESEIKARREKSAELNALLETDNKINNLLGQAKEYPNKDICNEILTNLEVLKAQINGCKKHGVSIPQLHCNNPKEIAKTVDKLKDIADKRDDLYSLMQENDDRISELNSSGDYNKQSLKLIKSLCEQQNRNILKCRSNGYPIPELKNNSPSDSILQHKHYANMLEIDRKITRDLSNANTIIQFKKTIENCDKQAENNEICLKKSWALPMLANSDIQQIKETVQGKIKAKEKKYKIRIGIIGAAAFVVLVVTLIIVFTVKSHEGKSVFPFDSAYAKGQNVELIQKELTDAGFTNIILNPDKSGWTKGGTVIEVKGDYNKGKYYDSNSDIHIKYSCEGRIEVSNLLKNWQTRQYTDVVDKLESAGFDAVSTEKTVIQNDDKKYLTSGLELNGIEYLSGECYLPVSAPINVSYYVYQIKFGIPSSMIKDKNYKDLAEELKRKGFSNITIKRADDMYHGFLNIGSWGKTEGNVKEFSIGGKTEFSEDDSFVFDDEIIITVHTYEDQNYEGITSKD